MIRNFDELLQAARQTAGGEACRTVLVVGPVNDQTAEAIREAREVLGLQFVFAELSAAVEAMARGEAGILMKGAVDTAALIKMALKPESGLRTGRLLSDVFVFEYAARPENRLVMITDGGLNIAPDLAAKVELIRNAVAVAHALGNANPKVAVLSASEFVQQNMPSSVDAAALAQMNARGQIQGCVVDGPLALDNVLEKHAAGEKGIRSAVAGAAEILLCPTIECANMLAKSTTYIGNARLAHVIVGARIPILIPSRADKSDAKLLSLALGMMMAASPAGQ
jgi:phosphate butyryltransferase